MWLDPTHIDNTLRVLYRSSLCKLRHYKSREAEVPNRDGLDWHLLFPIGNIVHKKKAAGPTWFSYLHWSSNSDGYGKSCSFFLE